MRLCHQGCDDACEGVGEDKDFPCGWGSLPADLQILSRLSTTEYACSMLIIPVHIAMCFYSF